MYFLLSLLNKNQLWNIEKSIDLVVCKREGENRHWYKEYKKAQHYVPLIVTTYWIMYARGTKACWVCTILNINRLISNLFGYVSRIFFAVFSHWKSSNALLFLYNNIILVAQNISFLGINSENKFGPIKEETH